MARILEPLSILSLVAVLGGCATTSTLAPCGRAEVLPEQRTSDDAAPSATVDLGRLETRLSGNVRVDEAQAGERFLESCEGFFSEAPTFTYDVDQPQRIVTVGVDVGDATVARILTPDGDERCLSLGDEGRAFVLPGVVGRHAVWLGTTQPTTFASLVAVEVGTAIEIGDTHEDYSSVFPTLDENAVQLRHAGLTRGDVPAAELAADCAGFVRARPTRHIVVTGAVASLDIRAHSTSDLVLVTRDADGRVSCNDDADGLEPGDAAITAAFPTGAIDVWVGTFDAHATAAYELEVSVR